MRANAVLLFALVASLCAVQSLACCDSFTRFLHGGQRDVAELVCGVGEAFAEGADFGRCPSDIGSLVADTRNAFNDILGAVEHHSVGDVRSAFGALKGALDALRGVLDDCGVMEAAQALAEISGKIGSFFGAIEEAGEIIIKASTIIDDVSDIVSGFDHGNYCEAGLGIGGLARTLA